MTRFDVAIVGAGPAGCRAARQLARGGARVALVDGSHPREKPCGGGVTGRALALAGLADGAGRDGVPIESASFEHRARRVRVDLASSGTRGLKLEVVPRRAFDCMLLRQASAAGATLVNARVTDVARTSDGWEIATREATLHAAWLIGADGPNSLVRRRVATAFGRADLSIATGYFVHGVSSREVHVGFVDAPAGYLWSFPRPDHLAVGVCAQADETTAAELQAIAREWIGGHVRTEGVRLERYGWPIPSLSSASLERERPAGDAWLLVGDAAGMVDPITREGIYFALASADVAAASLLAGGNAARSYTRRVHDEIYDELRRAARLKARFYRPEFMSLLITALERSARIRDIMAALIAGEQPYRGLRRRLLGTLEVGLMWELFRG
jgi:geranylgeranyl reductase family protein